MRKRTEKSNEAELHSVELKRRELVKHYKNEEKVSVTVSPMYRPYFGNTMTVAVNGITVFIPCDGKPYNLPKTHATLVMSRIARVDDMLTRAEKLQNVKANVESSPGDLKFY